jgi:putative transposase
MGLRLQGQESASFFFVTTSFWRHKWLGEKNGIYQLLAGSLRNRLETTGARLIGYVLMPSHLHLILGLEGRLLSDFMRDFKKFTAQKSLAAYAENGKLWQERYDRFALNNRKTLATKLNYIHDNPVRANLVTRPEDWLWSSARDYLTDEKGPLPVWKGWG